MAVATMKPLANYLMQHVGERINFNDILLALPDGARESSVRHAITKLMDRGFDIEVIVPGAVYLFRGLRDEAQNGTASKDRLFEQIGTTKDGSPILQAEDGALFIAREIN